MSKAIHGYVNFERYANELSNNFSKENPASSSYQIRSLISTLLDRINKLKNILLASKETSDVDSTIKDIITNKDSVKLAYDNVNRQNIKMPLLLQTIKNIEDQLRITQAYYKNQNKGNKPVPNQISTVSKVPTLPTVNKTNTPTTEIALTPDTWGIKFTAGKAFYMDLLPARQSTIPVQGGRDVPNAMPGLNYKLVTQVGKQAIPGFSPVYQNLGIKGMQVTIVGAFTGGDGSESTRKTDTPEDNSKTPWLKKSKGSPSLSDNPDRGGNLPELTAYNSYTEFVQLCQQGKHMEVEINLFQVYNQSTTTQIGQDIKLQSKNGNPNFTGIVRSLDVYHATKERTWYTLIMDVTDFGMASKKAINLNKKLEEAIKKAQAELKAAQAAEAKENAEQEFSTIPNDPESTQAITNIKQRILDLKDPTQKKKQLAIYDHLLEHIKTLKNKDNYAFKKYNGGQPWGTFISNIGTYSDSSFFPISTNQLLFRLRLDCRTLLGIQGTCDSELYWLLDGAEGSTKPITKFIGNGTRQSTFLMLPNEKKERITNDPFGFGPYLEEDGSESQKNSLLSQAKNLSNAERGSLIIKAIGCVAIGALGTVASVGTAGLATPGAIATTLGACAVFTSAEAYEKYDTLNKNEAQWSNAVWGDLAMDLLLTLGTVGLVRGGRAIFFKSNKQGGTIKGASSTVAQNVNKPVNDIADILTKNINNLPGKTVTSENIEYVIVRAVKDNNGKVTSVYVKNANNIFSQIPVEKIDGLDITLGGSQPKVTTPTQSQAAVNTVNRLDKAIDDTLIGISASTKQAIKSKPNKQTILGLMKRYENNLKDSQIQKKIKVDYKEGSVIVNEQDTINFSSTGVRIQNTFIIYEDITNVSTLPKTTVTKPLVKPQPIIPTSQINNLINTLDNSIINSQAKANLIANADDNFKRTVIELLNAKQTGTLSQYELYYAGNGTTNPITKITVSENNIYLYYSNNGVDSYSFTENISGRIRKVQSNLTPSSQISIPQQQTTQTSQTQQQINTNQQPSNSVTTPSISIPTGLNNQGVSNFVILKDYFNKQLSKDKVVLIEFTKSGISRKAYISMVKYDNNTSNVIIPVLTNGNSAPAINLNDITKIILP